MARRWRQLRDSVKRSKLFSLPEFPHSKCAFTGRTFASQPAFAWLKCEGETEDCESFLRDHKILTRSGKHFGESPKYVRISVLPRDEVLGRWGLYNHARTNSSKLKRMQEFIQRFERMVPSPDKIMQECGAPRFRQGTLRTGLWKGNIQT
ncbi:Tryptophan aminotransferase-related protein 2 [Sesamum angolense]|uniref:Tryptophan aminotransferase-related protein 2 n=1 Tax=Sesamum angolense TaxID=2727404 RepID=A0AAE1WKG7_9LAMI|nr:Tryptophan aminotransferase-related protein 2 [Sesamum angolense]